MNAKKEQKKKNKKKGPEGMKTSRAWNNGSFARINRNIQSKCSFKQQL